MMSGGAIQADDVLEAAKTLAGVAVRTPLLEYHDLNDIAGSRVLIKFEGAQRTGSFKFRGAYNRLARLKQTLPGEVVAWSSGNHAQGVAAAAKQLGLRATIVMPSDAPAIKIANTRALGAEIVPYDRHTESREAIATAIAQKTGATLVPSYDDPLVMAGQGTIGLEILEEASRRGVRVGRLLVCCGGGGLIAGISTIVKSLSPEIQIYSAEPEGFDDTARSLVTGRRESVDKRAASICDALLAPTPGELTFPINLELLSGGLTVTDRQVEEAMRFAFKRLKLVIEPGGAVALAAALSGLLPKVDTATVVVVSGSNVDADLYASIIARED